MMDTLAVPFFFSFSGYKKTMCFFVREQMSDHTTKASAKEARKGFYSLFFSYPCHWDNGFITGEALERTGHSINSVTKYWDFCNFLGLFLICSRDLD